MIVHDVVQRSPEWVALRVGRLTASRASDMLATTKSGWSKSRRNLLMQIVLERVTGQPQDGTYLSKYMQDGMDREPEAVACYEKLTGRTVTPVGFCAHDTLMAGCSPDGFIGDDGLVSIKSPIPAVHWEYMKTGVIPGDYMKQITHEMWITDRNWCDWLSYQPAFPENLRMKLVRVTRVEHEIMAYDKQVRAFLQEVKIELDTLATMSQLPKVLQMVTK